jgi:hypothetical protein
VSTALRESDTDRDGRVSLEDFVGYFHRLARLGEISAQGSAFVCEVVEMGGQIHSVSEAGGGQDGV